MLHAFWNPTRVFDLDDLTMLIGAETARRLLEIRTLVGETWPLLGRRPEYEVGESPMDLGRHWFDAVRGCVTEPYTPPRPPGDLREPAPRRGVRSGGGCRPWSPSWPRNARPSCPSFLAGAGAALAPEPLARQAARLGAVVGTPRPPITRHVVLAHRPGLAPRGPAVRRTRAQLSIGLQVTFGDDLSDYRAKP